MNRAWLNVFLALVLLALLGLHWSLRPEPDRRNVEALPGMVDAVPAEAYSASAVFADGKTLQEPPAGTVARGFLPLRCSATPEEALRAGLELANPLPAGDPAALARGKVVYDTYCGLCHGPEGKGDGLVAQRGFPAPPSLLAEKAVAMRDGQIFHVQTWGQGNMPPYAAQVSRADRWKAVLWVRELQKAAAAPVTLAQNPASGATTP